MTEVHNNFVDLNLIDDGSVVVDAGACVGWFIEDLRENLESSKCRVIALEPNSDNFSTLKSKSLPNVKIYNRALVGQRSTEKVVFYQYAGLLGWGNIRKKRYAKGRKSKEYMVKTIRINDIFDELSIDHIDFLKIDIEGAEVEVLSTMTKETASRIKQLSVEVHLKPIEKHRLMIEKTLKQIGYKTQTNYVSSAYGIYRGNNK